MLTERQKKILGCIIKEYTRSANPVGSLVIIKKYNFGISPATVRAEMGALEEAGYLYQPHTSAGRVPTDKGYSFFVNSLMKDQTLSLKEQAMLQEELLKLRVKNLRLARTTAKLLAALSHNLAISGLIEEEEYFQSGIRSLVSQTDFKDLDEVCQAIEMLDYLDQNIERLVGSLKEGEVKTLIGKENPLFKSECCSMVISRCNMGNGQNGLIAIMGPKRMRYARNISLIKYVSRLLKGT